MEDSGTEKFIRAIRLFNNSEATCTFETGSIVTQVKVDVEYFFCQTRIDAYQKVPHPAPRRQYVITLKGKLRFMVSDGSTFTIEPGDILVAEDIYGPGHTWELIEGDEWQRIYIPLGAENENHFIADAAAVSGI